MINPPFRNINKLFAVSCILGRNLPKRNSFNRQYLPLVEIKDFNALIDNKPFFDQPVKKASIKKTCRNVKKWCLFNRKLIRLFAPSKLI